MIVPLQVTHFSDPGCPWAWSASPAIAALRWRYGDQLDWRLVMIGLTESGAVYEKRGYTPGSQARGYRKFRHRGMPFATEPRERIHGTWPMCRVVVATRRLAPEQEFAVFRALQFAQFTSTRFLEDSDELRDAIAWVPGIDADAIIAAAARSRDRTPLRAGPRRGPHRRGRTDRVPGQVGQHRRPRALHGAEPAVLQRRPHARGRRLPDLRGLRRLRREPRYEPQPPRARRGRGRDPARVPGRPDDRRGRPDHGRGQVRVGPRRGRGRADRAHRRRARRSACSFGHDALWVPREAAATKLAAAA